MLKKRLKRAKEAFETAVKNDSESSPYFLTLGIAAAELQKPEGAKIAVGKVVELKPKSAVATSTWVCS